MLPMLADATDLDQWARRRDAQGYLPTLMRRLIRATAGRVEELSFPSGEGVQLGGWDGIVRAPEGDEHVPSGVSGWELGTNSGVKGKADDDYDKRRRDPLGLDPDHTTFLFVTPRRWGGKDDWVREKRAEGVFRDVRAYDADDLEGWLERAPVVHIWISRRLGKYPTGVIGFDDRWEEWSKGTRPRTSPEMVIAGREIEVESVTSWLAQARSGTFSLKAESAEQAVSFLGAIVMRLPEEEKEPHLARSVVVEDRGAWRSLALSESPLLLVPAFDVGDDLIAAASSGGHLIFVPVGSSGRGSGVPSELRRPSRAAARAALLEMGVEEEHLDALAGLARRSPMALRRRLSIAPGTQQPEWAKPENAASLLPALMAGAWEDGNPADREVVAQLGGTVYDEVSAVLTRWSNGPDPPARLVGGTWALASKEDAWAQLEGFLTYDDLARFEEVTPEVLGQHDPAYDLPVDQRWAAAIYGSTLENSGRLREGLADTLALMAARAGSHPLAGGSTGQERASRIVRELLKGAEGDRGLWASLSGLLPLLSEAAPGEFLRAVEAGLAGDEPALADLFAEEGMFNTSPHVNLLGALEVLARTRPHLARASMALARLARLDPGGRTADRPINSLQEIFMCLRPKTAANLAERMQVIDLIRGRVPSVGWRLLLGILPTVSNISYGISSPRYRDWAEGIEPSATYDEFFVAVDEVLNRLLEDAGEDGRRWADLVGCLEHLPKEEQLDAVVDRLLELDVSSIEGGTVLRDELRRVISKHRGFAGARRALPEKAVDRLEHAYGNLEPSDPVSKNAWLFSGNPQLPRLVESNWTERQKELGKRRGAAVREVHAELGLPGLEALAARSENPTSVGVSVGQSELLADQEEDALLTSSLGSFEEHDNELGIGFVFGRQGKEGWDWVDEKMSRAGGGWSATQKARFLARLPMEYHLYKLLDGADEETQAAYWTLASPYRLTNPDDCAVVTERFLEHGRPYMAVETLAVHAQRAEAGIPSSLIAQALEAAGTSPPPEQIDLSFFGHHVVELMDLLYDSDDVDGHRIARLEWLLLSLLDHQERSPKFLHGELGRSPGLFAEIIDIVYKPDTGEEEQDLSEFDQQRALQAYELLRNWRVVPGTAEDGNVDARELNDWVSQARVATTARGRGRSADRCIGRVLAASPLGEDGSWPHEAVRELIDRLDSDDVNEAFANQVKNDRGIYIKDHLEGGAQERQLARRYREYSGASTFRWPRTAAVLEELANYYDAWARQSDAEAELDEDS